MTNTATAREDENVLVDLLDEIESDRKRGVIAGIGAIAGSAGLGLASLPAGIVTGLAGVGAATYYLAAAQRRRKEVANLKKRIEVIADQDEIEADLAAAEE
jgi:hypothetical protein